MNIEQEIEKRASEIIKLKRRLLVIKCISISRKVLSRNVRNLEFQDLPFTNGERDMNWKGKMV